MTSRDGRLDGWKAIASYFGRERTTVIRWARDRALPVHSLPGGKTRTVYALVNELQAWARSEDDVGRRPESRMPVAVSYPPALAIAAVAPRARHTWLALPAGIAMMAGFGFAISARPQPHVITGQYASVQPLLPPNPIAATLFLQARDDWATRKSVSVGRSISELQRVVMLAPHFAPASADLAHAYLLDGEDGAIPAHVAFDKARQVAEQALMLDPSSASAHSAMGFIQYWWKHDPIASGREFREAIRLEPDGSQTHFWYANVLADNGQETEAMREFARARLAEPGSDQIGADYAWALWTFGHGNEAVARLRAIIAAHPENGEAQDCFGSIALARGDYATYLETLEKRAILRQEPRLAARGQALRAAFAAGGGAAMVEVALSVEIEAQTDSPYPDHSLAAFFAAVAMDRQNFLRVAALARTKHEHWGAAGYVRYIHSRWPSDPDVEKALDRLSGAPVEPATTA